MIRIPRKHTNSKGIGIGAERAIQKRLNAIMREVMPKKEQTKPHYSKGNRKTYKKK